MSLASNIDALAAAIRTKLNAITTALAGKQDTIPTSTTGHYLRGDKTWAILNKTAVGLANVDNTTDANKPVSTATQTALNAKANLAGAAFTGNISAPNFLTTISGFCSGKPAASEVIGGALVIVGTSLTASNCRFQAVTAATASTVFVIKNGAVQIGTATFGAGATLATVSITTPALAANDLVTIVAPATADATLANIAFVVRA